MTCLMKLCSLEHPSNFPTWRLPMVFGCSVASTPSFCVSRTMCTEHLNSPMLWAPREQCVIYINEGPGGRRKCPPWTNLRQSQPWSLDAMFHALFRAVLHLQNMTQHNTTQHNTLWLWQAPPPAWSVQYIEVLRPHWALPLWRTALPASHPLVKLTLLYIPLGRCCLSTLSALMAELTTVGRKKKHTTQHNTTQFDNTTPLVNIWKEINILLFRHLSSYLISIDSGGGGFARHATFVLLSRL